jgi:ribosomal protein S18 acetylase RimI-like enzyme
VELVRLYVQPGAQRQGIGIALLREAEGVALGAGATHLWLTVWGKNEPAIAFYRAMSYRELGRTNFVMGNASYENLLMAREVSGGAI